MNKHEHTTKHWYCVGVVSDAGEVSFSRLWDLPSYAKIALRRYHKNKNAKVYAVTYKPL